MSYYQTPIKQGIRKNTKSHTQHKAEDWVCFVCNNLNFSFRKKCNRCKTQTRSENQNQVASAYSQYYYNPIQQAKTPLSQNTDLQTPQPKKKSLESLEQKQQQKGLDITKIAKQYCPKDIQTNAYEEQSNTKKQKFANQFWQYINVNDFDEICQQQQKVSIEKNKEFDLRLEEELERMFSKILL